MQSAALLRDPSRALNFQSVQTSFRAALVRDVRCASRHLQSTSQREWHVITSRAASQRVVVLHVVVDARDFGFNRPWGPARFRANRGFASRRRAFAACEAHHPIVREWSEHSRSIARARVARRGRYAARRALRSTAVGRRRATVRNRQTSINLACFLLCPPPLIYVSLSSIRTWM